MSKKNISDILNDPLMFISRLKIVNKKGKLQYLKPTEEQIKIVEALTNDEDTIILKPRQIGSSTIICAYFFWCAYTATDPQTYAILSHKLASSKHILDIHKTFYYNLPASLQKKLSVENSTELRFKDSGAGIVAASSADRGGLRSFSVYKLHISEYAFADNPEELKATAIAALNDGQLVMESTANYYNDALHQEILKTQRGLASWKYIFFPWFQHKKYKQPVPKRIKWEPTDTDKELRSRHDLNDQQLYWRYLQIQKIGLDKFSREYPETLEDAYKQTGNSYFSQKDLEKIEIIKVQGGEDMIVFEDPQPDDRYAIGVDVAAGVNRDYSVVYVISKMTYQPVLIYRSNKITPVNLAQVIVDVSGNYNDALALVESNNYGNVVINELGHLGFRRFWTDENNKPWTTTLKSKTMMFENLKELIREGYIYNLDNITFAEIRSLQVNEKGNIIIPDNLQSHGDNAVALALCSVCIDNVRLPKTTYLPDWIKQQRSNKKMLQSGARTGLHRRY